LIGVRGALLLPPCPYVLVHHKIQEVRNPWQPRTSVVRSYPASRFTAANWRLSNGCASGSWRKPARSPKVYSTDSVLPGTRSISAHQKNRHAGSTRWRLYYGSHQHTELQARGIPADETLSMGTGTLQGVSGIGGPIGDIIGKLRPEAQYPDQRRSDLRTLRTALRAVPNRTFPSLHPVSGFVLNRNRRAVRQSNLVA
jgi:hypothetical protein